MHRFAATASARAGVAIVARLVRVDAAGRLGIPPVARPRSAASVHERRRLVREVSARTGVRSDLCRSTSPPPRPSARPRGSGGAVRDRARWRRGDIGPGGAHPFLEATALEITRE
jgi:hypothetical protein